MKKLDKLTVVYDALCNRRIIRSIYNDASGSNRMEVFQSSWGRVEIVEKEYGANFCLSSETRTMSFPRFWDKYKTRKWEVVE